jgi:hypothetical protein
MATLRQRYGLTEEKLAADLARVMRGETLTVPPPVPEYRVEEWLWRTRWFLLSGLFMAGCGLGAWFSLLLR